MNVRGGVLANAMRIGFCLAVLLGGTLAGFTRTPTGSLGLDEESTVFLQAKTYIFERNWDGAVMSLQRYLKAYPQGRYGDEAGFWLAKALAGLAGEERTMERALDRLTEAAEALSRLEKEHPDSRWLEEARPFRKELLTKIALLGGDRKKDFLAAFLSEEKKSLDQARLEGLDMLLDWDRRWAAPVIENLLKTVAGPEGRKTVVRFAARFFPDETEPILREAAAREAEAGVRSEIAAMLEKIEMDRLPVDAAYYVFSARLKNADARVRLPEMTAKVFDLNPVSRPNNEEAGKMADALFGGKLRRLKMKGGGILGRDMGWLREFFDDIRDLLGGSFSGLRGGEGKRVVAGRLAEANSKARRDLTALRQRISRSSGAAAVQIPVGDVTLAIPLAGVRKTPGSVGGRIIFSLDEKDYPADFSVDSRRGQLVGFRRGDDVWLAVLMFHAAAGEREGPPRSRRGPRFPLIVKDIRGCRVESGRDDGTPEEMTARALIDFGWAKAEIPGPSGRRRLEGDLLADKEENAFIGREAELFDPSGESVVRAVEMVVPVGAPEKYEIAKK